MLPTPKSLCWPGRHGTGGEVSVSTVPCTEVSMVLSCHLPPSLPVLVHQLCKPVIPSLLTCCHPISHPASRGAGSICLPQSCTGQLSTQDLVPRLGQPQHAQQPRHIHICHVGCSPQEQTFPSKNYISLCRVD